MSNNGKIVSIQTAKSALYNASLAKEQNYIGIRIAEARRSKRYTLPALSQKLAAYGVEITAIGINKWELGRTVPNAYQLLALAHALGLEDNLQFFICGNSRMELNAEGLQKLRDYKADLVATGRYKPIEPAAKIEYIEMPVSSFPVSAGTGEFLDESTFEKIRVPKNTVPAGADFGLYVAGDSMEPIYKDGQLIWVQKCEALIAGEIGVFVYDEKGYLKMYDAQEPSKGVLEDYTDSYGGVHLQPVLISYNEAYDPIVVSPNAPFQIVGRVLS